MKIIFTTIIFFASNLINAKDNVEADVGSAILGQVTQYCGDPVFLTCVDLKRSSCIDIFKTSIDKCDDESSALFQIICNEESPSERVKKNLPPYEINEKLEKAKRDFGKCTIEGMYSAVKEDLLVSCINSSTERLVKKL